MVLLFVLIALFGAVCAVAIFGDSPTFKNTLISRLRHILLSVFSRLSQWFHLKKHTRQFRTAIWAGQWSVPVFYFAVVSWCLVEYFKHTWHALPDSIKDSVGHQAVHVILISLIYVITILAIYSDPGTVTAANVEKAVSEFRPNELIFFPDATCSTCKLTKPARSKHCRVCNKCFMLFDHHCIWLNNCAGYYNYKYFLGFLAANIVLFVYGGYVCMVGLWSWRDAHEFTQGWWRLIVATNEANKMAGMFVILCVIFWIITVLFTGLHMRYIYLGVTTNELDKWSTIEYLVELQMLYRVEGGLTTLGNRVYLERAIYQGKPVYISLADQKIIYEEDGVHPELTMVRSVAEIDNVYDRGFFSNLRQRCCGKQLA